MKRKNRSKAAPSKKDKSGTNKPQSGAADIGRRNFMKKVRNTTIGLAIVGGLGLALTQYVRSEMHEHDLSRIDNGRPTVVQIHDPQCSQCKLLQNTTRSALKNFADTDLDYVVANIKTPEGRNFASHHRVQHVTLLLFNKNAELKHVLRGQRTSDELKAAFAQIM